VTEAQHSKNVVLRLPNWIGDAVMAKPAVGFLRKCLPDAKITALGKPSVNELYRYDRNIDELLAFELPSTSNKLSALREFSKGLKSYAFDLGITFPDSFSSALVFRMGGVRRRIGYSSELRSFLLTSPIKLPEKMIHRSEKYINLVESFTGVECSSRELNVEVSSRERDAADRFLEGTESFAVVCPTSRAPSRRWGNDHYTGLIRSLHNDMSWSIVLAGAADESGAIDRIAYDSGVKCLNLAHENDILLSIEVMRRSEVFVGNDSGAAHLAAASGTRVVSISGADDPRETRPLARIARIVNKNIECSPCVKNICPRKDHVNECMDVISVRDVMLAVREVIGIEK